jgi:hypothetical protein
MQEGDNTNHLKDLSVDGIIIILEWILKELRWEVVERIHLV